MILASLLLTVFCQVTAQWSSLSRTGEAVLENLSYKLVKCHLLNFNLPRKLSTVLSANLLYTCEILGKVLQQNCLFMALI